ncbi:MAG TPA: extracellular solute-binding protein [Tepidisphaeraceae bacterium]|nr:extracellular solute-binding protein [Tepidisphaeraceae bacterium]
MSRTPKWTLRIFLMLVAGIFCLSGCHRGKTPEEIVVYCGVDEPYASQVFADFEKATGLHVAVRYDIESSKSVGLAGRLEAEVDHPRADVWWGSEAFLTVRLASEGVLAPYAPPGTADISDDFKNAQGYWTGVGVRARVLAVARGSMKPAFAITGIADLADPRLKDRVAMSRPTAGATGAHIAALYVVWGPEKARAFFRKLHANGMALLGGNAEVADQVGTGNYSLGLTDSDDVTNAAANDGKLDQVVPDQAGAGTLAMPTTVALVKGSKQEANAKKLIDYLVSKQAEQKLIDLKFARWSVRSGAGKNIRAMKVDYDAAAKIYPRAQREATEILDGRTP